MEEWRYGRLVLRQLQRQRAKRFDRAYERNQTSPDLTTLLQALLSVFLHLILVAHQNIGFSMG